MQAKRFPDNSFGSIPPDSTSDLSADTYPDPALVLPVHSADQHEPWSVQAFPLAVYRVELPAFSQLGALGK
jgi:hypothetical protein